LVKSYFSSTLIHLATLTYVSAPVSDEDHSCPSAWKVWSL